ncbi:hypothetical protein B9Z55_026345 [Caenorhabditis nigoni]|uniref:Transmembrane protein n=1 Tax=Caenorhabditis nigoni TaxID=1611254 RepID=A0A2G5T2W7_9PELO|nr:hypothetical protein B9Z55_026345 [Caenorhabditis nigoni]
MIYLVPKTSSNRTSRQENSLLIFLLTKMYLMILCNAFLVSEGLLELEVKRRGIRWRCEEGGEGRHKCVQKMKMFVRRIFGAKNSGKEEFKFEAKKIDQ